MDELPAGYETLTCCFLPMSIILLNDLRKKNGNNKEGVILGNDKKPYRFLQYSFWGSLILYQCKTGTPYEERRNLYLDFTFEPLRATERDRARKYAIRLTDDLW